jgi:hypothetical protein
MDPLPCQPFVSSAGDLFEQRVQFIEGHPTLLAGSFSDPIHYLLLKRFQTLPLPHTISKSHQQVFERQFILRPCSVRSGKPSHSGINPMLFQEAGTVLLVPIAGSSEFFWVQHLPQVVSCRPEQDRFGFDIQTGKPLAQPLDDLRSGIMDDGQVRNQPGRGIKKLAKFLSRCRR